MWSNMMNGQGWTGMGFGMIVLWGFVALVVALLVARLLAGEDFRGRRRDKTAMEILRERYAAGEIDGEEFERKRRDLGG